MIGLDHAKNRSPLAPTISGPFFVVGKKISALGIFLWPSYGITPFQQKKKWRKKESLQVRSRHSRLSLEKRFPSSLVQCTIRCEEDHRLSPVSCPGGPFWQPSFDEFGSGEHFTVYGSSFFFAAIFSPFFHLSLKLGQIGFFSPDQARTDSLLGFLEHPHTHTHTYQGGVWIEGSIYDNSRTVKRSTFWDWWMCFRGLICLGGKQSPVEWFIVSAPLLDTVGHGTGVQACFPQDRLLMLVFWVGWGSGWKNEWYQRLLAWDDDLELVAASGSGCTMETGILLLRSTTNILNYYQQCYYAFFYWFNYSQRIQHDSKKAIFYILCKIFPGIRLKIFTDIGSRPSKQNFKFSFDLFNC